MIFFKTGVKMATGLSLVFDLIKLNVLFLITCLPIITIGASITAAYAVLLKMICSEDSYLCKSYWKLFRRDFRQSTIIWMILLAVFFIIKMDLVILHDAPKSIMPIRMVLLFLFLLLTFLSLYIFPVLSIFENSIKNSIWNALYMSFRYLPYTFLMLLFFSAGPMFCIINWKLFPYYLLYVFLIGFAGPAYLSSILFKKILDNYIPKEGDRQDDKSI